MIQDLLQTSLGQFASIFFLSMMPVIELRGGLPFGVALGLDYPLVLVAAVLGNMLPTPFIIIYIRKIFHWIRNRGGWCEQLIVSLEKKAHLKGKTVTKYKSIGLCILVAIPLPGTGAWTGALVAAFLDMRLKEALPVILLGVCIAAAIMSVVSYGVMSVIFIV